VRSLKEWIGRDDDEPVPARVRRRVFERFMGTCAECGRKIYVAEAWICDHRLALCLGGENRESNLGPIHTTCDREIKTPADVAQKRINNRVRNKHLGIKKKGRPIMGSKASGWKHTMTRGWERR